MPDSSQDFQTSFDYQVAFHRNLGVISPEEQKQLQRSRVAVAGVGGMGGAIVHALTRLGIGRFTLADIDTYEMSNFNRQFGATRQTIGRKKTEVMRETVLSINPAAEVTLIDEGIRNDTLDRFLQGADLVMDAMDFNCFSERFLLYPKAREKGIWVLNTAPPGFGYTLLVFDPKGMTFEDYFDLSPQMSRQQIFLNSLIGVTPKSLLLRYIKLRKMIDHGNRFTCVSPAFFLGAGMTSTQAFCLLLKRPHAKPIPWVHQFDAYLNQRVSTYFPMGMRSPWQRIKRWFLRRLLKPLMDTSG